MELIRHILLGLATALFLVFGYGFWRAGWRNAKKVALRFFDSAIARTLAAIALSVVSSCVDLGIIVAPMMVILSLTGVVDTEMEPWVYGFLIVMVFRIASEAYLPEMHYRDPPENSSGRDTT